MSQLTAARGDRAPRYMRVAAGVRTQIAEGVLAPGEPAPSGAELARASGYSQITCRKGLRTLIKDGVLVPGPSPNARPRVAAPAASQDEQTLANAGHALSAALAGRRRSAGLTQIEFARLVGMSVTTVGHAETGRLWQSRKFWERADKALYASGELLRLHDAYRSGVVAPGPALVGGADGATVTVRPGELSEERKRLGQIVRELDGHGVITSITTNENRTYLTVRFPRDCRREAEITIDPDGYCHTSFLVPVRESAYAAAKILDVLALAGICSQSAGGTS
jgi:transcriptional regulator with XRE-family HTH domain